MQPIHSPMRSLLLSSVSRLYGPAPLDDHGDVRIAISRGVLRRWPVVMRHPWDGSVVFVEGEPDNWREFIEDAIAQGELEHVLQAARAEGRAN